MISLIYIYIIYSANLLAYGSPYFNGGSDGLAFERKGFLIVNSNIYNPSQLLGNVLDQYDNAPFFSVYIGLLIKFGELFDGYSTFLPRIMNVYFLIWISMIFEYLLKKHAGFSGKRLYISILIFLITPNIQYLNSDVFRDTFNLFQIFLIILLFDRIILVKNILKKLFYFIIVFLAMYITFYTRTNSLVFAAAGTSLLFLNKFNRILKVLIIFVTASFLMLINFSDSIKFEYFYNVYSEHLLSSTDGLSSYIFKQPLFPFGIILRSLYGLINPFPNFLGLFKVPNMLLLDIVLLFVYCGAVLQIIFIPFLLKRLARMDWLALSFVVNFLGVVITTFTFRHVLLYYPFMVALIVDEFISSKQTTKSRVLFVSLTMTVLMGLLYIVLKFF
ncbi:hypothetical protein N0M98_07030 [Paenibacillus doosanensis]|nr:hypothetical protein [Paenibacillus doosanensis]